MTKPNQGCMNALQCLLCRHQPEPRLRLHECVSWAFMNGEQCVNGTILKVLSLFYEGTVIFAFI